MATLRIDIEVDISKATAELKKFGTEAADATKKSGKAAEEAGGGFQKLAEGLDESITKLKELLTPANLFGSVVGVGLVVGLKNVISATIQYVDELTRLKNITGASVNELASLGHAAGSLGVSSGGLQRALFLMSNEIQTAGTGLGRLGISIRDTDGFMKSEVQLLFEVSDKFKAMGDSTRAAAIARDIFGRGALELLPLLLAGSERLKAMGLDATKFGLSIGEAGRVQVKAFEESIFKADQSVLGLKVTLVSDLIPALQPLLDLFTQLVALFQSIPTDTRQVIEVLGILVAVLVGGAIAIKVLGAAIALTGLGALAASLTAAAAAAGPVTVGLVAMATAIIATDTGGLVTKLKSLISVLWEGAKAAAGFGTALDYPDEGVRALGRVGVKTGSSQPEPSTIGELQKQLALTQQLTQAQIALGNAIDLPIQAQIKASMLQEAMQLKAIEVAQKSGQFLVEDAGRVEQLKTFVLEAGIATRAKLSMQDAQEEIKRQTDLAKSQAALMVGGIALIERNRDLEVQALDYGLIQRKVINQEVLADLQRRGIATKAIEATLGIELEELTRRTEIQKEIIKNAALLNIEKAQFEHSERLRAVEETALKTALTIEETRRDGILDGFQREQNAIDALYQNKLMSLEDYVSQSTRLEQQQLETRLEFLDVQERAERSRADAAIDRAVEEFLRVSHDAQKLSDARKKIAADLENALKGIDKQREDAERSSDQRRLNLKQQLANRVNAIVAQALDLDLVREREALDAAEVLYRDNAQVMLGITARRYELEQESRTRNVERSAIAFTEIARQHGDMTAAFIVGFSEAADNADDAFSLMRKSGQEAFASLKSGLSDFLFDAITGAKSLGDAFVDVGKRILRSMIDTFVQIAAQQAALMLGFSLLSPAAAAAGGGGGQPSGSVATGDFGNTLSGIGGLASIAKNIFGGVSNLFESASNWIFMNLTALSQDVFGSAATLASWTLLNNIASYAIPVIGTTFAVIMDLLNGNIKGASLVAGGAAIGALIAGPLGAGIGAIIGGLIDLITDLFFPRVPHVDIDVGLNSIFMNLQDDFLKGLVGTIGIFISSFDFPRSEARRLEREIADALSEIVRQMLRATIQAQSTLPGSLSETITRRLWELANTPGAGTLDPSGNATIELEGGGFQRRIEALPNELIAMFARAVFGGIDITTLQRTGEALGDTFGRVLTSMVGLSATLELFGFDADAFVASLGTGDEALRAYVTASVDFFDSFRVGTETFTETALRMSMAIGGMQTILEAFGGALPALTDLSAVQAFITDSIAYFDRFAKEGETFGQTVERVVTGFVGLQTLVDGLGETIEQLGANAPSMLERFQREMAKGDAILATLADRLTVEIEAGGQPDDILAMATQLIDLTAQRYQAEIDFVTQLQAQIDQLVTSFGGLALSQQQQLGTLGRGSLTDLQAVIAQIVGSGVSNQGLAGILPSIAQALGDFTGTMPDFMSLLTQVMTGLPTILDPEQALQTLQDLTQSVTAFQQAQVQAIQNSGLSAEEQTAAIDALNNQTGGLLVALRDQTLLRMAEAVDVQRATLLAITGGLPLQEFIADRTAAMVSVLSEIRDSLRAYLDLQLGVPALQHGMDYVPYDRFPAMLHRGERVLTSEQNANLMQAFQGGSRPSEGQTVVNVSVTYAGAATRSEWDSFMGKVLYDARFGELATVITEKARRR